MKKHNEGFTLLEVMLSLAIIAIVFVTLLISQSQGLKKVSYLRSSSKAVSLAQQKIEEIKLSGFPEIDVRLDQEEENYKGFLWKKKVEKTELEGLRKITVIVNWFEGKKREEVSLATYIADRGK